MIYVIATNYIKEAHIADFQKQASWLVDQTNEKDRGCQRYELFQETESAGTFVMMEEWEDMECLEEHLASEHFKEAMAGSKDWHEKEAEVKLYQKIK